MNKAYHKPCWKDRAICFWGLSLCWARSNSWAACILFNLCKGSRGTLRISYPSVSSKPLGVKGVGGFVLLVTYAFLTHFEFNDKGTVLTFWYFVKKKQGITQYTLSAPCFFFLNFLFRSNYSLTVIIISKVIHRVPMYPSPNFPHGDILQWEHL